MTMVEDDMNFIGFFASPDLYHLAILRTLRAFLFPNLRKVWSRSGEGRIERGEERAAVASADRGVVIVLMRGAGGRRALTGDRRAVEPSAAGSLCGAGAPAGNDIDGEESIPLAARACCVASVHSGGGGFRVGSASWSANAASPSASCKNTSSMEVADMP